MARVLITRSPHQASELAERLRALGHEPILIPTIELTDPTTFAPLDAALAQLDTFHWLLFTSANAVEAYAKRTACPSVAHPSTVRTGDTQVPQGFSLGSHSPQSVILSGAQSAQPKNPEGAHPATTSIPLSATKSDAQATTPTPISATERDATEPSVPDPDPWARAMLPRTLRIAAIGSATARALAAIGLHADLLPPQAVAESLAETLLPHARQPDGSPTHFLLLRAEQARDILPDTLRAAGAEVTITPVYRTIIPARSMPAIRDLFSAPATHPDAITFTSSSTATNLIALLEAASLTLPPEILRISIGPITSQTLRDHHLPPHAEAAEPTLPALVEILVKILNLKNMV